MPGIEHRTFPRLPYRLLSLRVYPGYGALTSGRAPRRDFREFPFIARHHSYIRTARQQCLENRAAKPAATPVAMTGRPLEFLHSGTLILLCSFVAIDLFLGLDTRLVVGMKATIERHTVKGAFLHEDHDLRQVISLNNSVVDFPQHLALRVDVGAFWDVHHENRSNWFGAKLPVLAHTVRPPFTQKDPYVVWIRVGLM